MLGILKATVTLGAVVAVMLSAAATDKQADPKTETKKALILMQCVCRARQQQLCPRATSVAKVHP